MSTVIHVENLGKRYRIGERVRYLALRDVLARALSAPSRIFRAPKASSANGDATHIWALKDVSFDIHQGDVVGIIGRNGAGKTTLLKILARVTFPTKGFAEVRGRMGSLLEVGTGFHPELTGRENTFLSGAILGMSKAEIRRKFDEIVAFAEVEKFIDTPLKHYSTGMQTRLAFAVAAHLEPEILLVDEVLSVGDIQFQKKCLGKMGDVAKAGRTILFVSHQMNQIRRLCERVIWIDASQVRRAGPAQEVISGYEAASSEETHFQVRSGANNVKAHFMSWDILEPRDIRPNVLSSVGPFVLRFTLSVKERLERVQHGIHLYSAERQLLWGSWFEGFQLREGVHHFVYTLPGLPVRPGAYRWRASLRDLHGLLDDWEASPELMIETAPVTHFLDEWAGCLNIPCELSISAAGNTLEGQAVAQQPV